MTTNQSNRNFDNEHQPTMYKQGEPEFVPANRKDYHTYAGAVIDAIVPDVAVEPIFSINNRTWSKRERVDFARGQQMSAELKLAMDYWSIDKLKGRIILCPVNDRDYELLHLLIELAYETEGVLSYTKQKMAEVKSLLKGLFGQ